MKFKLTCFLTAFFLFVSSVLPVSPVFAETTTDVQIATESGATYLTTTTISTSSTKVAGATPVPAPGGRVYLPPGFFTSPNALTSQIFKIIMVISVILVFAYLVLGGIEYITSGGEKGKTEAARNKITSAIIGLIIVASSYAILTLALNFIGYRDVNGFLDVGVPGPAVTVPGVTPFPATPVPTPTPTPTSALQKLLQ